MRCSHPLNTMGSLPDIPTQGEKRKITNLGRFLRAWFKDNAREFPWREPSTGTYERICVEVLLQRTRAQTVAAVYDEFFARFPDWEEISLADESALGEFLKPLGLWRRRISSLKQLANYAADRGGAFPDATENSSASLRLVNMWPMPYFSSSMVRGNRSWTSTWPGCWSGTFARAS